MKHALCASLALFVFAATGCKKDGEDTERGPDTDPEDTDTDTDSGEEEIIDADEDGFNVSDDCDDTDPDIHPGAKERCNGKDDDCDDEIPELEDDLDGNGQRECEEECGAGPESSSIATDTACEYVPESSGMPFAARVEWNMTQEMIDPDSGAVLSAYTFAEERTYGGVFQAPSVLNATDDDADGDIDNDDTPDIAVVMGDADEHEAGVLRLISGDGTKVHDSVRYESFTNANGTHNYGPYHYSGVAMGQIDGDDAVEIVALVSREVDALCWPAIYEVSQSGTTVELTLENVYGGGDYYCAAHAPALADIDGDGTIEIIYGRNALNAEDLTLQWSSSGGRGWYGDEIYGDAGYWNSGYHSFPYDLDGDGVDMEVVAGRTVFGSDGSTVCSLGTYVGGVWVDATDGYPGVADILRFSGDSAGEPEIVITGDEYVSIFHGVADYDPNGLDRCLLIDQIRNAPEDDTAVSATMPDHPSGCDTTRRSFGGQPTVADFDGDHDNEVGVAGSCWYSVYGFDDTTDTISRVAMYPTKDWSSASTGSTVFDFNGDQEAEIVFSDEEAVYVWGYDDSASLEPWERLTPYLIDNEHKSWTIHEYPLVADTDGDGKAEIVVVNSHLPGYEDHYGIYVLGAADDDWVSARNQWNQHAYYVTNIEDDGSIGYAAPNYAPYTKADYNAFRQQAPGNFGALAAADLSIRAEEPCQEGCGEIVVWVQVENTGAYITADKGVIIGLYGAKDGTRTFLDWIELSETIEPGEVTEGYAFLVNGWDSYDRLVAVVDDPSFTAWDWGTTKECDESDNEVKIQLDGLCP